MPGATTDSYRYTAFGDLVDRVGTDPSPFRFAGESLDETSGLYDLRARWLEPGLGRFVSADPFGGFAERPGSLHKYVYAENDPVSLVDPSGLFASAVGAVGVIAVAVAVLSASSSAAFSAARSEAWKHSKSEWNYWDHIEFRRWIRFNHRRYVGQRIDCADLAVTLLVDFASRFGLPVHIHAKERRFDSRSTFYRNPVLFREALKDTITARKIWELNSYRKGYVFKGWPAEIGDLMMSKSHTRIFLMRGGDAITYMAGSLVRVPGIPRINWPTPVEILTKHERDVRSGTPSLRWWKDFVFRTVIP